MFINLKTCAWRLGNNFKQAENRKENSSLSSANESYSDLSSNSEENLKLKTLIINNKNSDEKGNRNTKVSNKPFCNSFNVPNNNQEMIEKLIN